MTYDELRKIAQPHIRENDNLPSNALLLLTQLHIPYKTKKQCEKDFKGKYNPLDNHPAFLFVKEDEKVLYFKTSTRYYNFYIYHEIAHYILGHEDNSPQNELDANMLACILAAPIENFPTNIKTAQDLSEKCNIPIDRAEEYWHEIKNEIPYYKKTKKYIISFAIPLLVIIVFFITYLFPSSNNISTNIDSGFSPPSNTVTQDISLERHVYVTISGKKYHTSECSYVKYKNNLTEYSIDDAIKNGYTPCSRCFQ